MPQILVVTDSSEGTGEVVYRETVSAVHVDSAHAGGQLVERLTWALDDARALERRARFEVFRRRQGRRLTAA